MKDINQRVNEALLLINIESILFKGSKFPNFI